MIKVSLNLPEEEIETLRMLAAKRKTTVTAVVRSAIATERFLEEEADQGAKFLVEKDNRMREVVFKL